MDERVRFHLDENVNPVIASGLRRYGIDVTTTLDAGLLSSSDQDQLAYIQASQRVIFTQDADFLMIASRTTDHPDIAYCQMGSRSVGEILEALVLIYEVMTSSEMRGQVEFL